MKTVLLLAIITSLTNFQHFCPWGNIPVCGVDFNTYKNQCALAAAYVELSH